MKKDQLRNHLFIRERGKAYSFSFTFKHSLTPPPAWKNEIEPRNLSILLIAFTVQEESRKEDECKLNFTMAPEQ